MCRDCSVVTVAANEWQIEMIATGNFGDTTVPYVRRSDAADGGGQLIERLLDSLRDVRRPARIAGTSDYR